MPFDQALSGRTERRLPIIVVVRLAAVEPAGTDGEERTFTDNISAGGARVFSTRSWQLGDAVRVTPRNEDSASGSVVYCQKLDDGRFVIGVEFQDYPASWSAIRKYDGIHFNPSVKPKSTS
jgi:sulfite reductase alpha subunit-like flavoprotein